MNMRLRLLSAFTVALPYTGGALIGSAFIGYPPVLALGCFVFGFVGAYRGYADGYRDAKAKKS